MAEKTRIDATASANHQKPELSSALRESDAAEQECRVVLEKAFAFLNEQIAPEHRLDSLPELEFIRGSGVVGEYKIGSNKISINTILADWIGIDNVAAHEFYHFWQDRDGQIRRIDAFRVEKASSLNKIESAMVRKIMLDAGAYFFTEFFLHELKGNKYPLERHMLLICVDFLDAYGYRKFKAYYESIKQDDLTNLLEIGLSQRNPEIPGEQIKRAIADTGLFIGALAYAACDYDAKRTMNLLSSGPKEILNSIKEMDVEKFNGLIALAKEVAKDLRYDRVLYS